MLLDFNPPDFSDGLNLKSLNLFLIAAVNNAHIGYSDFQMK